MKWLKRILIGLLVIIVLIVGISFFLPKTYHIERSATTTADASTIYGIVNNLKTYDSWMPWNQIDPNMQKEFGPKTVGQGAYYTWNSTNSHVGSGKLSITESSPALVATDLDFGEMGTSKAGWRIEPGASSPKVTWYIDGRCDQGDFMWQVMGKWMNAVGLFDKMMGSDFDKGLASLKKIAEAPNGKEIAAAGLPPGTPISDSTKQSIIIIFEMAAFCARQASIVCQGPVLPGGAFCWC
jgi:hypothetical protein